MSGYGTVVYHFGRAGSARAMYPPAFSHSACHFGSTRRKSNASVGRVGFEARRARDLEGGRDAARFTLRARRRGLGREADVRFRLGAARLARACGFRPPRVRDRFATCADRSLSRKAFPGAERPELSVGDERFQRLPSGIRNKNRAAGGSTISAGDGGPLSYVV